MISTGRAEPLPGSSLSSLALTDSVPFMPAMQWSTYQGDMHVKRPSQWNPPYSSYQQLFFLSGYENPQPEVFHLCLSRMGNISVCNCCRNKFDKQHQLTWVFSMRSGVHIPHQFLSYLNPAWFGNAYYHASPRCILARWSVFSW